MRHEHQFRCVVDPERGACSHPRENLHFEDCAHFRPLPPNIEVPYDPSRRGPDYRSHGEQVEGRHYGEIFSIECGNQAFGNDLHRGHVTESEYLNDYGDYPAPATRGRGAQARHHDSDFEDQYGGYFDHRGGQPFNASRACHYRNMFSHRRGSSLNHNHDELTDESENHSSGSEMYFSDGSYGKDDFSGLDGGQDFSSDGFSRRARGLSAMNSGSRGHSPGRPVDRGFSTDSSNHHLRRAQGPSNRRSRGSLAFGAGGRGRPRGAARGGGARRGRDSASANGATNSPTYGNRGGRVGPTSGRGTRRGGRTPAVVTNNVGLMLFASLLYYYTVCWRVSRRCNCHEQLGVYTTPRATRTRDYADPYSQTPDN